MLKNKLLSMGFKPVETKLECLDEPIFLREMSYKGVLAVAKCITPTERSIIMTIYSLCDENGNLVFTEDDKELVAEQIPYTVISEIAFEAAKLTKFDDNKTLK
ncbi:hypothetical protein C2F72_RS01370 [Vibrio parahaemolyticus]|nr:hypothetical protein [Vibrio parahaemolyticus]